MVALTQSLYVYDTFGLVECNAAGPTRPSLGFWGDGLFLEAGVTNLIPNPSFELGTTGVGTSGAAPTFSQSSARSWTGSKCLLVNWPTVAALGSAAMQTITISATGTYALSTYVWVPAGSPAVSIFISAGTGTFTVTTASTVSSVNGKWQRIVEIISVTGAGTFNIGVVNNAAATSGQFAYTDAWQVESGAVPTTYCDGAKATLWNAAGALYTQDFEGGTTASWTAASGTIALSTAAPYSGTANLRLTATGAGCVAETPSGTSGSAASANKTYSAIAWVKGSAARTGNMFLAFFNSAGTLIGSATGGANFTLVVGTYIKLTVTTQAPVGTAYVAAFFQSSNSVNADTFDIDAVRVEEGTACAAYYWTGAENNSSSVRIATSLTHALPGGLTTANAHSFAIRAIPGYTQGAARLLFGVGLNATNVITVSLDVNGNITSNSVVAGVSTAGPSVNIGGSNGGDQLIVGYTLSAGGVFTVYASKNGAAYVSAALTNAAYNSSSVTLTSVYYGAALAGIANLAMEHGLFYNAVLVQADFDSLRTTATEPSYVGDTRILYAFLTGTYRNIDQALSANGVGQTRQRLATTCYLENNIAQTNITSDDDAATTKITVAANSGIGVGDTVSLAAGTSTQYTVKNVFSTGGAQDELWVA